MSKPITKTATQYITGRVQEVVRCTNGKISTKIDEKEKHIQMTFHEKRTQVRTGKAKLRTDDYLYSEFDAGYNSRESPEKCLDELFVFQKTDAQKRAEKLSESLENQREERHIEVELAGKRLVDKCALGIVCLTDVPSELEKLARMADQ